MYQYVRLGTELFDCTSPAISSGNIGLEGLTVAAFGRSTASSASLDVFRTCSSKPNSKSLCFRNSSRSAVYFAFFFFSTARFRRFASVLKGVVSDYLVFSFRNGLKERTF